MDSGSGSGLVVDSRGLVATNYHLVQNTRFLAVQFPFSVLAHAEIVKLSARYDLAILKVHPKFWEEEASDSEPPGTGVFLVTGAWDEGCTNPGSEVFRTMTNEDAGIVAQKGRDGVNLIAHRGSSWISGL